MKEKQNKVWPGEEQQQQPKIKSKKRIVKEKIMSSGHNRIGIEEEVKMGNDFY